MTLLAPVFLLIAGAAAAALFGLHFITRHRPPRTPLPTTRFVPESAANITALTLRLSDRPLLALRTLAIVAAGLGLAGPILDSSREPVARVVIVDVSRAVADAGEARDSAVLYIRAQDRLVQFDSTARMVHGEFPDSLVAPSSHLVRGSLSAALVAGLHAAAELRDRADSVELVLVSPLVREQIDAATLELRALHPGRIRIVRVRAAEPAVLRWPVELRATPGDPLRAALALGSGALRPRDEDDIPAADLYGVRIARDVLTGADSQWVRNPEHVLVFWPEEPAVLPAARSRVDSVGAVVAGRAAVLASFERRADPAAGERVVARWGDGVPAATERRISAGGGCVREVAVPVPAVGDLVLRHGYSAFVHELIAPCGGHAQLQPADDSTVALLRGEGSLLATDLLGVQATRSPLTPWLLALALMAALVELPARRRRSA